MLIRYLGLVATTATAVAASPLAAEHRQPHPRTLTDRADITSCPGYNVSNIVQDDWYLVADLTLAGPACNVYGQDLPHLRLLVEYQTNDRLHVEICDAANQVYQVQESFFPRPTNNAVSPSGAALEFNLTANPFSFTVKRKGSDQVLFDSSGTPLVFESQYIRLRTQLPSNPNLYGLGEHSDSFRLGTEGYIRTLWNAESPFIPTNSNLYGSHPVYFDHRGANGTHGVFLLNSNGMDVKIDSAAENHFLEYNVLGGVLDLYFMAGPGPVDVSKQYAEIVGLPPMVPYWAFGFHQCKYGYFDVLDVAEVVANYSNAEIPLEVMWTDINYMDLRQDFTTDLDRFPMHKMQELVDTLHNRTQRYVLILDPGIHMNTNLSSYNRGVEQNVFLKTADNDIYQAVAWPGVVAYPDWFHPNTTGWWSDELSLAFNPDTGIDIDGVWVDMNEASNFCPDITCDPAVFASQADDPPAPTSPVRQDTGRPINGFPADFQPPANLSSKEGMDDVFGFAVKRGSGNKTGLSGRNLLTPEYNIVNHQGNISNRAIWTNITNYDGTTQYDTHNFYGTMHAFASRAAMLSRRPTKRPFVLTRSTFASAGSQVAHWFGDNASLWDHYRITIAQMMAFVALHQMPIVGSDVCGFNLNTTEELCSRWAMLGAFQPFYRNHADITALPQEFYLWPTVTAAAKKAIAERYKLADYIYTALRQQTRDGTPLVTPLWFAYPNDTNTFANQLQWFYGPSLLISPVTEQGSTDVSVYLPDDLWYDYWTGQAIRGQGASISLTNVTLTDIPIHIKGGSVLLMREESAMTLTEVREKDFVMVIAPGLDGNASGALYVDDGENLDPEVFIDATVWYDAANRNVGAAGNMATGIPISRFELLDTNTAGGAKVKRTVEGPFVLSSGSRIQL